MHSEEPITYLNSKDKCLICFGKPEKWENHQDIDLIKHHVSYFPQVIAFVHYQCHAKIHDPNKPLTQFIQYESGDSIKFYNEKEEDRKRNQENQNAKVN